MARKAIGTGVRRVRGLALLLAVTAFAMTGCLRYELSVSLNDDGSGVIGTLVAISDAFTELSGASTEELVPTEQIPPNVEVSEYRQDGFTGIQLGIPFANEAQLGLITAGMSAGAGVGEPGDFTLERNDAGGWTFSMIATVESSEGTGGTIGAPPAELLQGAFFRVRVALPGEVVEHNADSVEDGALVWELELTATEPRELSARTAAGAPQPPKPGHGPGPLEVAAGPADGAAAAGAVATGVRTVIAVAALVAVLALARRLGRRAQG